MFLTLGALIDHKFVFDKLSEDFVAATVFEASDRGQKTHWDDFMVLHPHFYLCVGRFTGSHSLITVSDQC